MNKRTVLIVNIVWSDLFRFTLHHLAVDLFIQSDLQVRTIKAYSHYSAAQPRSKTTGERAE